MPADEQTLPEGTDHVIVGAGAGDDRAGEVADAIAGKGDDGIGAMPGDAGSPRGSVFDRIDGLKAEGYDRVRDYAVQGKDRATGALDELLRTIDGAASQVDAKLGGQYGDYARRAAQGLGSFNEALKNKDVDELFTDARDLVARAPAVAVGAAAALGFVVARLARAGADGAASGGSDPTRKS